MRVRFEQEIKSDPERMDGMKVHYGPARRQAPRLTWYLVIFLVASPLIYMLGRFIADQFIVQAKGQVATPLFVSVYAVEDGVVDRPVVRPGERVQQGEELLRMAAGPSSAAHENMAPADPSIAEALASDTDRARLRVDRARERLEKMRILREQGAATSAEVEQALMQWLAALDSQALLQKETPRMISDAGAGQLAGNERVYSRHSYWSPGKGQVRDIFVKDNDPVQRGDTLMTLDLANADQITAYLEPKYLRSANPGHRVVVVFPDGTRLRGTVTGAEEFSERPPADVPDPLGLRRRSLVVRVSLDNNTIPPRLDIAGLPVTVRF